MAKRKHTTDEQLARAAGIWLNQQQPPSFGPVNGFHAVDDLVPEPMVEHALMMTPPRSYADIVGTAAIGIATLAFVALTISCVFYLLRH
jgi:hypothetical protein